MEDVANFIASDRTKGKIMYSDKHNDRYKIFNSTTYFDDTPTILKGVERLIFLTGHSTASASELLINCMRPYRDVIIIGEKTNGKPFGMYVFDYDNTVLSPVSFESFNANDVSSSSEGLMPTILAQENLKNDFGDLGETCLKTAISFIFGKGVEFSQYKHTSAGRELYHGKDIFGILKNNNQLILQR